jgi:hypothetical protein
MEVGLGTKRRAVTPKEKKSYYTVALFCLPFLSISSYIYVVSDVINGC